MSAIQEFDLPARWTSLLQDKYSEAIHNLAKMWPDEGSLEVSYREVEGYDHEFAQDILANPEHHFRAANQALRRPPFERHAQPPRCELDVDVSGAQHSVHVCVEWHHDVDRLVSVMVRCNVVAWCDVE